MAFEVLNPLAALWQRRGLTSLLMPRGFDALAQAWPPGPAPEEAQARPRPRSQAQGAGAGQTPGRHAPGRQVPEGRPAQGQPSSRALPEGPSPQRQPPHPARQAAGRAPDPALNAVSSGPGRPLPPQAWPAPWRAQLEQTRPGLVLWTYWNLGADLCRSENPGRQERRAFLQRLLQGLGHPAGTHTFWPACLPPGPGELSGPVAGDCLPHAEIFWSGVSRLKARGVVVMGSAAAAAVGLRDALNPLQQVRHGKYLVWGFWDVDNLLHDEQRYASMLAFLRQALLPVLGRA